MSLLKQVIEEMAAGGSTGAGSVAAVPGGLFKGGVLHNPYKKWAKNKGKMLRRVKPLGKAKIGIYGESLGLSTDETNFDPADVVSKLDTAEKKVKAEEDTVSFGLEDDEGNLVRVYVRTDQAREFEAALAALLGDADENDDDVNTSLEIAEVLFDLKNKFEIVDVNWGDIPTDEEEEQEVEGGEEGDMEADLQAPEGEMDAEMGDEMGMGDEMSMGGGEDEAMKSTLQQVIDMLKSNAEAQKAEAEARKAEAKAKEAEYAAKAAESKIRQEEQVLDMETYYKNKQEGEKEAKKLAKLAKFKHDKAQDAEATLSSSQFESVENDQEFWQEEEEEDKVLSPDELAHMIFFHLQANK